MERSEAQEELLQKEACSEEGFWNLKGGFPSREAGGD